MRDIRKTFIGSAQSSRELCDSFSHTSECIKYVLEDGEEIICEEIIATMLCTRVHDCHPSYLEGVHLGRIVV
jgi:hypothetical protein